MASKKRAAPKKRTEDAAQTFSQDQMTEMVAELTYLRAQQASSALSEKIDAPGTVAKKARKSKKSVKDKAAAAASKSDDEVTEDSDEERDAKLGKGMRKSRIERKRQAKNQAEANSKDPVLARLDGIFTLLNEQGKGEEGELRTMLSECEREIGQCRAAQSLSSYQHEATLLQVTNQFKVASHMRMLLKLVKFLRGHTATTKKASTTGQTKRERDIEEIVNAATNATEEASDLVMIFGQADHFGPKLIAEYTKNRATGAGHGSALDAAKTSCHRDQSSRHFDQRAPNSGSSRPYPQQSWPQASHYRHGNGNQDRGGNFPSGWPPAQNISSAPTTSSGSGGNYHYGPAEGQLVVHGNFRDGGGGGIRRP